jgi:hypothetical protein
MESSNAALTIGGTIKRTDIPKLAAALADDNAAVDWTERLEAEEFAALIREKAAAKEPLYVCNNDQPWGEYEATTKVCTELGLIYVHEFEAGGDWHPALIYRSPAMGWRKQKVPVWCDGKSVLEEANVALVREWAISEIGHGPMLAATDIEKHLDAGTLMDEIALITAVHKFPWPLEIAE